MTNSYRDALADVRNLRVEPYPNVAHSRAMRVVGDAIDGLREIGWIRSREDGVLEWGVWFGDMPETDDTNVVLEQMRLVHSRYTRGLLAEKPK